jgi:hypothetical protein
MHEHVECKDTHPRHHHELVSLYVIDKIGSKYLVIQQVDIRSFNEKILQQKWINIWIEFECKRKRNKTVILSQFIMTIPLDYLVVILKELYLFLSTHKLKNTKETQ